MKITSKLAITIAATTFGVAFYAAPASAQATRTWVSGVGDDVNPCSRTAPCKTFAGAISKTAAGGEINCLDPGGFGTVTITKSITIDCSGTFGSSLASGVNGFNVNDSASGFPNTIRVILRGLSVNGAGGGAQNAQGNPGSGVIGINFTSGAFLLVEDVIIQRFNTSTATGISFRPGGNGQLVVNNTVIVSNGNGIDIAPTGTGTARAAIHNVAIVGNTGIGIRLNSQGTTNAVGAQATIDNAEVNSNGQGIIMLSSGATANALAMITNSNVSNNTTFGLQSNGAAARGRVGNTTITMNGTGVNFINGGDMPTYGNNRLNGNTVDGAFTSPAIGQQ